MDSESPTAQSSWTRFRSQWSRFWAKKENKIGATMLSIVVATIATLMYFSSQPPEPPTPEEAWVEQQNLEYRQEVEYCMTVEDKSWSECN